MDNQKRHPHADVIHAWADGDEVQYWSNYRGKWIDIDNPNFYHDHKYRIKPTPKQWYEAVPEHGVLCWVKQGEEAIPVVTNIVECIGDPDFPWLDEHQGWRYAAPLTNSEIRKFLRPEGEDAG